MSEISSEGADGVGLGVLSWGTMVIVGLDDEFVEILNRSAQGVYEVR